MSQFVPTCKCETLNFFPIYSVLGNRYFFLYIIISGIMLFAKNNETRGTVIRLKKK